MQIGPQPLIGDGRMFQAAIHSQTNDNSGINEKSRHNGLFSFSTSGADRMICWKSFQVSCAFTLELWECTGVLEVSCSNSNAKLLESCQVALADSW